MVTVTLMLTDTEVIASAIDTAVVRVFNEDGTVLVTQGQTDSDGSLVLELEDGTTYWVRFFKVGYSFDSRLLIEVDSGASSNTFDVRGQNLTALPPSTSPYLCRASGYLMGADFSARPGVKVTFSLTGSPRVVAGFAMVTQDVIVQSDADGWVDIELVRGAVYDCVVAGIDDVVYRVVVPDRVSVSFTELVWPYIAALDFQDDGVSLSSVTVDVDGTTTVDVVVTLSSGVETPYTLDGGLVMTAATFSSLTTSDPSVATVDVLGGVATIRGVAAGTATLSSAPNTTIEIARLPEPARSFPTLTVVVS